ncbi:uncharacterized protein LOC114932043 [Nylanderia fulva]|uniref:uncharacterized protein LOC114932043 n=1 Tax=Nylanderia fulva TaxID=613905 RepID=UPI0010FB6423|nr:uncharacterized protein LOC114932043 [Nylanderia fulva]
MQMTMQTMSYFVILTTTFYFQYHMLLCFIYTGYAVSWKCLLTTYIWCITDTIRLVLLNYICESVSAKAQKTKSIILKLTNLICFANAREEICQFILQLLLRPLKFTGMGLFYFGYKFLCKFFVSIFSVIVIVIQMDTSVSQIVSSRNNVTCKLSEQKRNAD